METSEKTIDVLNDLIKINNDRVAGFEKAGEDLDYEDRGLQSIFSNTGLTQKKEPAYPGHYTGPGWM